MISRYTRSQLLLARHVLVAIGHVPRQPYEVLGTGPTFGQHLDDVAQRLRRLLDEVVALELLLAVPSDHAAEEQHPPGRGDAVRVAQGRLPVRGAEELVRVIGCLRTSVQPSTS